MISILFFALALFGLELTVGVSWAVTLDIGGDCAGSVSAVMNTLGNIGAALAAVVTGYIVKHSGWTAAFSVLSVLCVIAAALFLVDRRIQAAVRRSGRGNTMKAADEHRRVQAGVRMAAVTRCPV